MCNFYEKGEVMDWYSLYKKEIVREDSPEKYIYKKVKYKKKLINLIRKYAGNKVLEAGCGTGVISSYVSTLGYQVTGIDIDDKILQLATDLSSKIKNSNVIFEKKSIFEMPFTKHEFDVSFSNGVLEHFSDIQIIDALKKQSYIANYVIFGIPTRYFKKSEAMYGDERYLSIKFWRNLIMQANCEILEEKNMQYESFFKRIKRVNKYLKPRPFRIFVIRSIENE